METLPFISNTVEQEKIWKEQNMAKSFFDFLRHDRCPMTKGIRVCKRSDHGIISLVRCLECSKSFTTVFEDSHVSQVRVVPKNSLAESVAYQLSGFRGTESDDRAVSACQVCIQGTEALNSGDHIAWHRPYGIWHHAIVIESLERVQEGEHCFTSICNGSSCCIQSNDRCKRIASVNVIEHTFDGRKFQIKETVCDIFECMDVCRFEYCASYPPEYTVELAKATLRRFEQNEMKESYHELVYDPLGGNCEHFARRCKTGSSESGQVKDCLRECSKGILMSLLRMVSLLIWFICEAVIDEESSAEDESSVAYEREKEKLNRMEIGISAALSVLFYIVYLLYSFFREIEKIRHPYNTSEPDPKVHCCERGLCYREDRACLWCIVCLFFCRPFYESLTGCSACGRCCSKTFGRNCDRCFPFCTNHFNVFVRLFLRECIATGLPIAAFILFEVNVNPDIFAEPRDFLKAFCGFLVSLCVSFVTLPLGICVASLCEILYLGCCLGCCPKRRQSV